MIVNTTSALSFSNFSTVISPNTTNYLESNFASATLNSSWIRYNAYTTSSVFNYNNATFVSSISISKNTSSTYDIWNVSTLSSNASTVFPTSFSSLNVSSSSSTPTPFLNVSTSNLFPQNYSSVTSKVWPMNVDLFSSTTVCPSGTSEVVESIDMAWWGTNNYNSPSSVKQVISQLAYNMKVANQGISGVYTSGNIVCGVWYGPMISNEGAYNTFIQYILDNIDSQGIPNTKYFVHYDFEPMKTIGLICDTTNNVIAVQTAIKNWSQGIQYNSNTGSVSWSSKSICYLDYSARKQGNGPDQSLGNCNAKTISSGDTASSLCNVNGDDLTLYNPNIDFSHLQVGQQICCSAGISPDKCLGHGITSIVNIKVGWWGTSNTADKTGTNNVISSIQNIYNSQPNVNSVYYSNGNIVCGAWMGGMVDDVGSSKYTFLSNAKDYILNHGIANTRTFEYINTDALHSVGLICDTTGNSNAVKIAVKGWSQYQSFTGIQGSETWSNTYICTSNNINNGNSPDSAFGTCNYVKIKSGQSPSDACNLDSVSVSRYNPNIDFTTLQPNQPICCSIGSMPDLRPNKNTDGSCYSYTVQPDDSCQSIIAQYWPLSINDVNTYNKQTFGWLGCTNGHPWIGDILCLSDGTPPKPAVNPMAECGPQASDYNISCPLNACCSEYGFCGTTSEFCDQKSSLTGAPGTSGCLSNCGYGEFTFSPVSKFQTLAYWIPDNQTPLTDIDGAYDIIVYSFLNVLPDLSIDITSFQNTHFTSLTKSKRIVSIGGWDFSTNPATYQIFRNMVDPKNNDYVANVIAGFVQDQNLDGVDFDWEYPGEPDISGIPAGSTQDGYNYAQLIRTVRLRLNSSKTVSATLPASFWYLKNFDITLLNQYVDYFEYMTYDLHGQWDYGNKWSGNGHVACHTNFTETSSALQMIIKSGIPSNKILVGTASYARSFLVNSGCSDIGCEFMGPTSGAQPGVYSNVAGFLTFSDIDYIKTHDTVNKLYNDPASQCTILLYNNDQWAAWTTDNEARALEYKNLGFRGVALWAVNYVKSNPISSPDDCDIFSVYPFGNKTVSGVCSENQIIEEYDTLFQSSAVTMDDVPNNIAELLDTYTSTDSVSSDSIALTVQSLNSQSSLSISVLNGITILRHISLVLSQVISNANDLYRFMQVLGGPSVTISKVLNAVSQGNHLDARLKDLFYVLVPASKTLYDTANINLQSFIGRYLYTSARGYPDNTPYSFGNQINLVGEFIQDAYSVPFYSKYNFYAGLDRFINDADLINTPNPDLAEYFAELALSSGYEEDDICLDQSSKTVLFGDTNYCTFPQTIVNGPDNKATFGDGDAGHTELRKRTTLLDFNKRSMDSPYDRCNTRQRYIRYSATALDHYRRYIVNAQLAGAYVPPLYVVNLLGGSPGVACNVLQWLLYSDYVENWMVNGLLTFTRGTTNEKTTKRRTVVTNSHYTQPNRDNDEFPFATVREGLFSDGTHDVSVLSIGQLDNRVDGNALNRFYSANRRGQATSPNYRLSTNVDYTTYIPNDETSGQRYPVGPGDTFVVMFNLPDDIDCNDYATLPKYKKNGRSRFFDSDNSLGGAPYDTCKHPASN